MSATLPERIETASRRPKNLGAASPRAISLAMGEPFADTAAPIRAAVADALAHGRTRYTQLTGLPALREAIAEAFAAEVSRSVSADQIVVTHGGSAGLAATTMALVGPGDRVILPEPTYSLYIDHLAMVGAEPVWVPATEGGRLDLAGIDRAATGARMLVLCSPNNPTGLVTSQGELRGLADVMRRHPHLLLLSDEAYAAIVFDDRTFQSAWALDDVRERVIVARTFSKAYAMTGWRLGYIVAHAPIAAGINLVHRTINGALNTFVQDAGIVALRTPEDQRHEMVEQYQHRRNIVVDALTGVPGLTLQRPEGAFYAFPQVAGDHSADDLVARYAAGGVLVRSGTEFGPSGVGHVRLSFATDIESLTEGLRRFVAVTRSL